MQPVNPFENRGVEALALSIVDGLRTSFDDPNLTVLAQDLAVAERSLAPRGVATLPDFAFGPRSDAPLRKRS